jgi:LmeA-like phospholipid-binding
VSEYPNQPSPRGGWPEQPPVYSPADEAYGPYGRLPAGMSPGVMTGMPPRRRRRRRRGWIALLVTLVVLAVLFFVGDQVAKAYAENMIAQKIETSGLNTKPSVHIEGWPFLTQIAGHDVKAIDISANNATADNGKLTFSFTAKATGVHLNSSFNGATIDQINGHAVFPFSSIANAAGLAGVATISADPADGPDAVQASAPVVGSITGTIKQTAPNQITLTFSSLSGLASLFSGALPAQSTVIDIPALPAGLQVKSVTVTSQGIVATASATNTTLTQ